MRREVPVPGCREDQSSGLINDIKLWCWLCVIWYTDSSLWRPSLVIHNIYFVITLLIHQGHAAKSCEKLGFGTILWLQKGWILHSSPIGISVWDSSPQLPSVRTTPHCINSLQCESRPTLKPMNASPPRRPADTPYFDLCGRFSCLQGVEEKKKKPQKAGLSRRHLKDGKSRRVL